VCCSVLQCVAVCCSVLQCVAVCYTVIWTRYLALLCCSSGGCIVVRCGLCCSVLQRVAVCCSKCVFQCVVVNTAALKEPNNRSHPILLQTRLLRKHIYEFIHCNILHHTAPQFTVPQYTATHCNTPHFAAMHSNTLQHTAMLQQTATDTCAKPAAV